MIEIRMAGSPVGVRSLVKQARHDERVEAVAVVVLCNVIMEQFKQVGSVLIAHRRVLIAAQVGKSVAYVLQ
jgi:hypothetical protein